MGKLRVLHIVNSFGIGGMENGVVHIINNSDINIVTHALCTLREAGRSVERILNPEMKLYVLGNSLHKSDRLIFRKISYVIKNFSPDIIHVRSWGPLLDTIAAHLMSSKKRIIVFSYHGKSFNEYPLCNILNRIKRNFFLRFVDHIVTLNHDMAETLKYEFGVNKEITIIPNGVDTIRFAPSPQSRLLRYELNLPVEKFLFGTVGRLSRIKDIGTIIKASSILKKKEINFGVVIVGGGDQKNYLQKLIDDLDLNENIFFAGETLDVDKYLKCIDVYIQSSLYEGFSNTILEAMSTGVPIVATNTGGNANLVKNNYNGFLFSPMDYNNLSRFMIELYRNEEKRNNFSKASRYEVLEKWSLARMVESYNSFYDNFNV